jgi:hypothetical protein
MVNKKRAFGEFANLVLEDCTNLQIVQHLQQNAPEQVTMVNFARIFLFPKFWLLLSLSADFIAL